MNFLFKVIISLICFQVLKIRAEDVESIELSLSDYCFESEHENCRNLNMSRRNVKWNMIEIIKFSGFSMVENLNLEFNRISGLEETVFIDMIKLQELSLRGNLLKKLPANLFKENVELMYVDLSENMLKVIPWNIFEFNIQLEQVLLCNNVCINRQFSSPEDKKLNRKKLIKHLMQKCPATPGIDDDGQSNNTLNNDENSQDDILNSSNALSYDSSNSTRNEAGNHELLPHLYVLIIPVSIILAIILIVLCCVAHKNFMFYLMNSPPSS